MKLQIHDTTLRDGEQAPGNSMTVVQKKAIANSLERMGVDIIEPGFPAASPEDFTAVAEIAKVIKKAIVCAFSRCTKGDIDQAIAALKYAQYPQLEIVVSSSDIHLQARRITPEENLQQISQGVSEAKSQGIDVKMILEDATRANSHYLKSVCQVALQSGASSIIIADTVGDALPDEFSQLVQQVRSAFPSVPVGVHCHDDLGLAVANTLAAVRAGAQEVQVTLCGIGERAGNAALEEVVAALSLKTGFYQCTTNIDLTQIYPATQQLLSSINHPPLRTKAIVGENAFATEAGMHQSALLKNSQTYEAFPPELFGRSTTYVLGRHSGRSLIRHKLLSLGLEPQADLVDRLYSDLVLKGRSVFSEAVLIQHYQELLGNT
ncbi:LeuA family protein [Merismopedia glauca]|uniref:2-isopropylmalate synthase n=1 Tax=Merismopedia glauca CCAP 1448/3 TaxID=1296344 RepID=A0A2T1C1R8_9CYAN|nr:hypothetical protein [Merismopedia glauca]PSB02097.1 hypothetical protein C7B64_14825 [Merismopedia glauca CCAP 1448/3]